MARAPSQTSCPACRGPMENGFCVSLQDERYFDLHLTLWLKTMFPDAKRRAPDSVCTQVSFEYQHACFDRLDAFFECRKWHGRHWKGKPVPQGVFRYQLTAKSKGGRCTLCRAHIRAGQCSRGHRIGLTITRCSQCDTPFFPPKGFCECGFHLDDVPQKQ